MNMAVKSLTDHGPLFMFFLIVSDYGLFSQDDDPSKGKWLEPARTLDFYPLKSGVSNYY